jgi:hypothetical protein
MNFNTINNIIENTSINLMNRNFIFLIFLIYIIFFNHKVIFKIGEKLEKSSYKFISKIGKIMYKSGEYHINQLNKIPLYLKILDIVIMFAFWGGINTVDKLYKLNQPLNLLSFIIFGIYSYTRNNYYKKI